MQRTLLSQAITTLKGELIQDDDRLALATEDGLVALEPFRGRSLPFTVGTCVIFAGYPRFSPRTKKLQSLAVVRCGFSIRRSPGSLSISGRIFAADDGQIIIQVVPQRQPAFFIPVAGYLPNVKEGEFWRLECVLEEGLATLVDGQKLRNAYQSLILKRRKRNHSSRRQKAAA
jgi:hypothetical protein